MKLEFSNLIWVVAFVLLGMYMVQAFDVVNAQPSANTVADTAGLARTDSLALHEFEQRISRLEGYIKDALSDNIVHPGNVMEIASVIIATVTLLMFVFNIYLGFKLRSDKKDYN